MTEYIKFNSDRPDYNQTLVDLDNQPVDLTNATSVSILMWDKENNLLINDSAEIDSGPLGEVHYDFSRGQIASAGTNLIEFQVVWDNGDRQWFPIDTPAFELQVTPSGGDREADLQPPDTSADSEVGTLTINGDLFVADDDGELDIQNADVRISDGSLTVSESVNIGNLGFSDDEELTFGNDNDFLVSYDTGSDTWVVANGIGGTDVLRVSKGGDLTLPNGSLIVNENVSGGGPFTIWDASAEHIPLSVIESTSLTVAGNTVGLGGSTGVSHADLDDSPTAAHHTRYADDEAQDAVGSILSSEFAYDATVPEITLSDTSIDHDVLGNVLPHQHHARYTDTEAVSAISDSLGGQLTYDASGNGLFSVEPGNITHDDLAGVGGNNHHTPLVVRDSGTVVTDGNYVLDLGGDLSANDAGDGTVSINSGREQPNAHVPETDIPDADHVSQPVYVPDGSKLDVWVWGVRDDTQSTPTGLEAELYDESGGASVASASTPHTTGSPIASLSAAGDPVDATLRVVNGTGSPITAGGSFGYTVVPDHVVENFDPYADTADMRSAWDGPSTSAYDIETTDPIEGSQSATLNASGEHMSRTDLTTNSGDVWSVDYVFEAGAGLAGLETHVQDTSSSSAILSDAVRGRIDFANSETYVIVAEGGTQNDSTTSGVSETLTAGTRYRLLVETDDFASEATVTLVNVDTETVLGSATADYDTSWSGGSPAVWAQDTTTTLDYLRQEGGT